MANDKSAIILFINNLCKLHNFTELHFFLIFLKDRAYAFF